MVFSSTLFIFFFLPLVLLSYLLAGRKFRNLLLLIASLVFYAWGEPVYVAVMLFSIVANYFFGLGIGRIQERGERGGWALCWAVLANIGLLCFFKYADLLRPYLASIEWLAPAMQQSHLPMGISFFTFQAISYVVDVYRKVTPPQRNILNMGLFIALFPKLMAGPIVRYHDIVGQLTKRTVLMEDFATGVERFIFGLSKKVLIANPLGNMADMVFALQVSTLSTFTAWLGIICYTLQLYFDFSGYSDMAIGLGRMFGFSFLENFNYPYISRSIQEFWRRWHISLSNWFRDYLYIPLGGNRLGPIRTSVNLLIVFFFCGMWHGASWNFIAWGLLHGFFLMLERGVFGRTLQAAPLPLRHIYFLFVIMNTWVFFRLDNLPHIWTYLSALYGFTSSHAIHPVIHVAMDLSFYFTLIAGVILAMPIYPYCTRLLSSVRMVSSISKVVVSSMSLLKICLLGVLFLFSSTSLIVGAYNPFIYFRF
ncbi:MAG: MBOAT family protein [Deltaproteobacteria bacterium]|nr:MBOAT family protein [Deltaproteobacteria bacterium]